MQFSEIREHLRSTLARALETEARLRDLTLDPGLAERAAADPGSSAVDRELRGLFGDEPPLSLVGFDTPGIQRYLFRVRRPVDLLGGSSFVRDFTDPRERSERSLFGLLAEGHPGFSEEAVIFAGGGGGLLLVPASRAGKLACSIGEILKEQTRGDLVTVAETLEIWPRDLGGETAEVAPAVSEALGGTRETSRYAAAVAGLEGKLRRRRAAVAELPEPIPAERYIERCHACGRQVGKEQRHADGERERVCPGCEARRRHGAREKRELEQAEDFEIIVRGLPEDSLAVLWADGANVGRAFQRIRSPEQHRALSLSVDAAMDAVIETAAAACPWLEEGEVRRWQTPLRGGDDLVLILPAMAAVEVLLPMIDAFEASFASAGTSASSEESKTVAVADSTGKEASRQVRARAALSGAFEDHPDLGEQIREFGLGIGLVMAHHRFPIQLLVDYARQLLKSAKGKIDPESGVRSAVDFSVLHSGTPLSKDIGGLRARHWRREPEQGNPGLLRTLRPYARDGFAELLERTRLLRQVGPSQLHAIARELDLGHRLSRSLWRYQHARARPGEGWALYREALGRDLGDVDELLWRPAGEEWLATDLLDARELYDLVSADGSPQADSAAAGNGGAA